MENEEISFSQFLDILSENGLFSLKNGLFLIILSVFNWFFEILKWQSLVKTVTQISFYNALQQSLAGLTASLITPNKIGDYGAKLIYFSTSHRKKVVLLNLIGHMTQMGVTTVFGCFGLVLFVTTYNVEIDLYQMTRFITILLLIAVIAIFGIRQQEFKIKGFSLHSIWLYIKNIPKRNLSLNVFYAIIRYLIFSFQFGLILSLFNVDFYVFNFIIAITSMYLLASVIPTLSIFDIVIKSSVALYIFSFLEINPLIIISTTTLMWILNFVLPSLIGSYFVLNFKLPNTNTE